MFHAIGRYDDRSATNRRVLTAVLLGTTAWTALWAAIWVWAILKVIALLKWLAIFLWTLLMAWLFPRPQNLHLELLQLEELEVMEVALEDPEPIKDLASKWEDPGEDETLGEDDLAEAQALLEELREAERREAAREAERVAMREMMLLLEPEPMEQAQIFGIIGVMSADAGTVDGVFAESTLEGASLFGAGTAIESAGSGGLGGLGTRSSGIGGGGSAEGLGGLGTKGTYRVVDGPHTSVTVGSVEVDGDLPSASATLARKASALRYCYERTDPERGGDLKLRLRVRPDGSVSRVDVLGGSMSDPDVISCAQTTARRVLFAPSPDGVESTVTVPLAFKP